MPDNILPYASSYIDMCIPYMVKQRFISSLQVVYLMRDDILPYASSMPPEFTEQVMAILNRGSIHATSSDTFIGTLFDHAMSSDTFIGTLFDHAMSSDTFIGTLFDHAM